MRNETKIKRGLFFFLNGGRNLYEFQERQGEKCSSRAGWVSRTLSLLHRWFEGGASNGRMRVQQCLSGVFCERGSLLIFLHLKNVSFFPFSFLFKKCF